MFHPTLHKSTRLFFAPIIMLCEWLGNHYPKALIMMRYYYVFHRKCNLIEPRDLNEKILWAKLYADTSCWTELADKYKVREYIKQKGLGNTLVQLYAVWYDVKEVDWNAIPEHCIIKANNGDGKGTNRIIHKSELDKKQKQELLQLMDNWLHRKNIGALHAEPHYKHMTPCVIAEELLPIPKGQNSLTDYKIWCFNGNAYYIWVCNNRSLNGNSAHVMTYDRDWNAHPEYSVFNSDYLQGDIMPRPDNLEQMLQVAETLSDGFPQVRVDLYNVNGNIYFGELTFTSQGGLMDFYTPEFLQIMGDQVDMDLFQHKQ